MTRCVVFFETFYGMGRLVLDGDLPLELDLPATRRWGDRERAGCAADRDEVSPWGELLARYFAGERVAFPLDLERFFGAHGFTVFAREVLRALARVPYGRAVSYGDLAAAAGHPNAYRAAGTVMAKNPLPVILPCHRVVHSDGSLGRYGDDPSWKPRLLALEGVDLSGLSAAGREARFLARVSNSTEKTWPTRVREAVS
jgi:O-6-methylguanine DNA methyltransferase